MQRYFLENQVPLEQSFVVEGEIFHHVSRVMRMKEGQQVIFVQPDETAFVAEILKLSKLDVQFSFRKELTQQVELPIKATIICGLSKGSKTEIIVQKGTELGAFNFVFFESQYSISKWDEKKQERKIERLNKIAQEAAEQSHRTHAPKISFEKNMMQMLEKLPPDSSRIVAYEESAKEGEHGAFVQTIKKLAPDAQLFIVFGPEGGLSTTEIQTLAEYHFVAAALGPRIMRAETAPFYALSALSYALELNTK